MRAYESWEGTYEIARIRRLSKNIYVIEAQKKVDKHNIKGVEITFFAGEDNSNLEKVLREPDKLIGKKLKLRKPKHDFDIIAEVKMGILSKYYIRNGGTEVAKTWRWIRKA